MSTQSTLDLMVAGITADKTKKAAGLTPVGTERKGPLDGKQDAPFPFDDPQTVKQAIINGLKAIAEARSHLKHVEDGLNALATTYGLTDNASVPVSTPVDMQKAREREADARVAAFEAEFKAKQEAAQAAVFVPPKPEVIKGDVPADDAGWKCPKHGTDFLVTLTSRKGRKYRNCTQAGCSEFEGKV